MSGVLKKACWLLPVLFVVSPVLAQQGGGIQSAANIESHISFMSVFRGLLESGGDRFGDAVGIGCRNSLCPGCTGYL